MFNNLIKEKIKEIDIFSPYIIVIFGYLAIFLLAVPYYYRLVYLTILKLFIIVSIFILSFTLPFFIIKNIKINKYILYGLLFIFSFYGAYYSTNSIFLSLIYLIFLFVVIKLYKKLRDKKIFTDFMFYIGLMSFILLIIKYHAIPLFDYNVRMAINTEPLRLISMGGLIYGSLESKYRVIISFILLTLMGYKVGILLLVVSYIVYKKIKRNLFIYIILLFIVLNIMGWTIVYFSPQNWKINFYEFLSYRAYFDLYVFKKIVESGIITYGKILFTPNGERLIGELLFNKNVNYTTTMFGTVYMDFNLFGVVIAFLIGLASKILYEGDRKIYAIYSALLLGYCEIGINFGFLVVLILMLTANGEIDDKVYNKNTKGI